MNFPERFTNTMRFLFEDGLDEVLIFAFIFIFILLTGHENDEYGNGVNGGIVPLILIGVFLLLYSGFGRTENRLEQTYETT